MLVPLYIITPLLQDFRLPVTKIISLEIYFLQGLLHNGGSRQGDNLPGALCRTAMPTTNFA